MKPTERTHLPAVGGSSLLVIFAVLCLTVFALLGLSTVQADTRLADASVAAIEAYYTADCEAEAILAHLRNGEIVDGVWADGNTYSYTCPISAYQELAVTVQLSGAEYLICQWQILPISQWESDDTLEIWDGAFIP